MRLNEIAGDSRPHITIQPTTSVTITFHLLPKVVRDVYLSKFPYEAVRDVYEIPGEEPLYIIRNQDHTEHAFWPDGAEYIPEQDTEEIDPEELDWLMQQHYGKPEDYFDI